MRVYIIGCAYKFQQKILTALIISHYSSHRGSLVQVLHQRVEALPALLVQHVFGWVLQAGRKIFVKHLARSE